MIRPRDSRFGMRWDGAQFHVALPNGANVFVLSRDLGAYVYATLRGQERIEQSLAEHPRGTFSKESFAAGLAESGHFSEEEIEALWEQIHDTSQSIEIVGGSDPTATKRPLYRTAGEFVRTEHGKPEGNDALPRTKNRSEDCHIAAREFMRHAHLEPISTEHFLSEVSGYAQLAGAVGAHSLPQLLEIYSRDTKVHKGKMSRIHSCIVLGKAGDDFVCFEKIGTALAWRFAPLKEIFDMYETHFKQANEGRPQISWSVNTLEPK